MSADQRISVEWEGQPAVLPTFPRDARALAINTDFDLGVMEVQLRELVAELTSAGASVEARARLVRARNEVLLLQREIRAKGAAFFCP